ncbi:MAG TPA: hypothetical protein VF841_21710 [Anaeromyxobacter sp.]
MIRLALKLALAAAAVWAVWTFVPVRGRTLAQRWDSNPSVSAFVEGAWAELRGPARPQARGARPGPGARERPTERHTEADRREVDRLLSEHLGERR